MLSVKPKWRPSLWGVVLLVVLTLVMLPLAGLLAARLTSNQFVRETEASLNHQAALFAASYEAAYRMAGGGGIQNPPSRKGITFYSPKYHPIPATLRAQDVLGPPPEPRLSYRPITEPYLSVGKHLTALSIQAQKTTLSGFKAVDALGRVIGGTGVVGYNMANVPEVKIALLGEPASALRLRSDQSNNHPLKSLSRDTSYRVFVAQPVFYDGHVVGAVYLSRTPLNLGKFLYQEAPTLLVLAVIILMSALLVGVVLWRLISAPLKELEAQSLAISDGIEDALVPLNHYGTREVAALGQSFATMADRLRQRSSALKAYSAHVTHELKSPVSSILGAAELLDERGIEMPPEKRRKFYSNIRQDAQRMNRLLDDVRTLAQVKIGSGQAKSLVADVLTVLESAHSDIKIVNEMPSTATLPLSVENAKIVLGQLVQNAAQHGAKSISVRPYHDGICIADDGKGITLSNEDAIFDPFFTTKRDSGGTGMGLAIVQGLLEAHGGKIALHPSDRGAAFIITF